MNHERPINLEKPLAVAVNGKAKMVIAGGEFTRAPKILASYLHKITGGEFESVPNLSILSTFLFQKKDHGEGGFAYRIFDKDLIIEAGSEQAAVYAVYDLLERVVGCRYYTSTCEYVPKDANLVLHFHAYEHTPVIQYRELYYKDYEDPAFAEKHKLSPSEKHESWGFWCHSFKELLPAEKYFDKHPEYFSLIDGKRIGKNSQLCLSNPEVLKIVTENLRQEIKKHPEAKYWSVSQNDNDAYCQCEECRRINEEEGSPMGSVLRFVNQVAAQFPDKTISTLAYWYTRKPPKEARPAENTHIMLCNIEANRGLPIETDDSSRDSREELLAWKDICGNLFLWDYCIQFRNLCSPFPNLRVLGPNIRFFVKNNVRSLFSQCNREVGGEFSELRGYMLAKLMWDPDCDERAVMEDFLRGYYKQAAPYILAYIDRLHDGMEQSGGELRIFGSPVDAADSYLSQACCEEYEALFTQAEDAVRADEETLFRVRTAHMPLWYAQITLGYGSPEERRARIAKFASQARKSGLEKVEEWEISVDRFVTDAMAKLAEE